MTTLTNEVATLKVKVANLEAEKNSWATKQELARTKSDLENAIAKIAESVNAAIDKLREFVINALAELRKLIRGEDLEPRVKDLEGRMTGVEKVANAASNLAINLRIRVEKIEAFLFGNGDPFGIGSFRKRLEAVEVGLGDAQRDIKYILDYLSKLKKKIDDLWGQIKLIWAAIAVLQGQVAGVLVAIAKIFGLIAALTGKITLALKLIANLEIQIQFILKLVNNFKINIGRPGRDGKDGRNGLPGRDGLRGLPVNDIDVYFRDSFSRDATKHRLKLEDDTIVTYDSENAVTLIS